MAPTVRVDLGAVDDRAPVQHGVVRGLLEPLGECLEHGLHADVLGAGLVVAERQSKELVAEDVVAAAVLGGEAGPTQGTPERGARSAWAGERTGQLVKSDAVGVPRELDEDRQDAVGPDESVRLAPGSSRQAFGGTLRHISNATTLFRLSERSS